MRVLPAPLNARYRQTLHQVETDTGKDMDNIRYTIDRLCLPRVCRVPALISLRLVCDACRSSLTVVGVAVSGAPSVCRAGRAVTDHGCNGLRLGSHHRHCAYGFRVGSHLTGQHFWLAD